MARGLVTERLGRIAIPGSRVMKTVFRGMRSDADQTRRRKGAGAHGSKDELRALLLSCKSHFVTVLVFSFAVNLLYLAGPLYMLQVYDRVVSSASIVTLVMLTLLLLQFRQWPVPYSFRSQEWLLRLHSKDAGIPYGIALAIGALMIYPETGWMKAVDLARFASH